MKLLYNLLFTLSLLTLPFEAWAFIPNFKMIMSRTAENHGKGLYQIIQDVALESEPKNLVIRETWYIKDGNQMRLEVKGRNQLKDLVNIAFIYNGNRRTYIDSRGIKKVSRPGSDWFEPYFHFRFQKNIKPMMVTAKMAPIEILEDDNKNKGTHFNPENPRKEQPFLRLSRVGGTVAWAIGYPTPRGSNKALPGMWIEQDQFLIRKLRFPSQTVISANSYSRHSRKLKLPSFIKINLDGERQIQIQVVRVNPLPLTKKNKELLSEDSLDFSKDPSLALKIPKLKPIIEFYKRFR